MSILSEQQYSDERRKSATTDSGISIKTDTTWRYDVFGPNRLGRGAMIFNGPDGIRDHRQRVVTDYRYVGEGTMSPEGSSEVDYLWRPSTAAPHPRPKSKTVGEIGWGVPEMSDWFMSSNTGKQIQLGEFRQAVEDRHTHLFQNAWYPSPEEQLLDSEDVQNQSSHHSMPGSTRQSANHSPYNQETMLSQKSSSDNTAPAQESRSGPSSLHSGSGNSLTSNSH